MNRSAAGSWSLRLGRWRGVEVRLHVHFPIFALLILLAATLPPRFYSVMPYFTVRRALGGIGILLGSVILHEAARALVARRVGGRTNLVVLGPTGGWAQPHLPSDPPAHLVTAVAGPLTYLAIIVAAACGLAISGEQNLLSLFSPLTPHFLTYRSPLQVAAELTVWVNTWLLLVNLLPIQPCDGAEVLKSLLWPLVGRASASAAAAHIAYGAAAMTAIMAIALEQQRINGDGLPQWFPLAMISVLLLYGGNRAARQRQYDMGVDIDQWESDDEQWLNADWLDEDRAAVLVEQLHQKQQDALDRKRREREDREDARVDDILARMHEVGFEQLSDEEQAILKRASRRYRQRQQRAEGAS
jgi:Zn-dependent protease